MGCHGPAGKDRGDKIFNQPVAALSPVKMPAQLQNAEELEPSGKAHRVVMHLNFGEEKLQKGMLNNIRNLYDAMGAERLDVELVAHGAGLSLFIKQDAKLVEELEKLKALYGVSYTACSNTMKAQGLTRADLIDQVDRTMPAMVRLMELQERGWAYIKP
jgi:intracellular sulfur oxidation DsrE/DsrF family protein